MTTTNQPTSKPTRKVGAMMIGGAAASVIMGAVNAWNPEMYQGLMQPGFEAGLATLIGAGAGYFVRERL